VKSLSFLIALTTLILSAVCPAVGGAESVDYQAQVKPILAERCYACHGALKQESSLRLDTAALAIAGGDSGEAITPGKSADSLLIERILSEDERMPPEGDPLSAEEVALIRRWVDQGAAAPADESPQIDPADHWAFQPPVVAPPRMLPTDSRNLIDRYLAKKLTEKNLTPAPPARPEVLLRRVYLDLIGLPPTTAELADFLNDQSPNAFENVVDRLLASPQYGERWGRHWMDVWRYSDWTGEKNNQVRGAPEHIWRWRDWIVESLNSDQGYHHMIRDMLAADEIAPEDTSRLRATGFLARNWYKFNRTVWLEDTVEHTGKAFLGLTFNCAKCHDHKYDPISQKNYFQMRAFFEPYDIRTQPVTPSAKESQLVRVYDAQPDTPTYLFIRGIESSPDKSNPLSPDLPHVLGGEMAITSVKVPAVKDAPDYSTGRRLALANWLIDPKNPLTARVAVNHLWLRHFGAALVPGMSDFGLRAPRPEYAELLDHLAVEFMSHNWSMKHLHRLMVCSDLYRRASHDYLPKNLAIDPDNQLLWRMNHRRLEGETLRDSVLYLAGNLDLSHGGKEIALDESETSLRRSIYFRHGHERQAPFLKTFDGASVLECYQRNVTVLPQQALALSNSILMREQSRYTARRLSEKAESDEAFVVLAFQHLLTREPTPAERKRCIGFLESQRQFVEGAKLTYPSDPPVAKLAAASDPALRARESLVHVLFNHNDFITCR